MIIPKFEPNFIAAENVLRNFEILLFSHNVICDKFNDVSSSERFICKNWQRQISSKDYIEDLVSFTLWKGHMIKKWLQLDK